MASGYRRRSDESASGSSFPAGEAQFFKIIDHGILHDKKMRIPREFTKKYGNHLSNTVFLKIPTGAVWTVELVHSEGNVWLQNGWQEFKEYYSIDYGHFLVFRYDGNSHFHVLIFDMSASEIDYPFSATHVEQTNNNAGCKVPKTDDIEVDDSVEILNDFSACQTRPTTSKTMPSCKTENDTNWESNAEERIGGMPTTPKHLHTKASGDEKDGALQRARAYKSEDPFFMVFMQPSYVTAKFTLNIPLGFAQKYFADKQNIILRVSDGRTWSVKCSFAGKNAKLTSGWKSFVQDNHLKVGDVAVFQLIKGTETSLKVIIF